MVTLTLWDYEGTHKMLTRERLVIPRVVLCRWEGGSDVGGCAVLCCAARGRMGWGAVGRGWLDDTCKRGVGVARSVWLKATLRAGTWDPGCRGG